MAHNLKDAVKHGTCNDMTERLIQGGDILSHLSEDIKIIECCLFFDFHHVVNEVVVTCPFCAGEEKFYWVFMFVNIFNHPVDVFS